MICWGQFHDLQDRLWPHACRGAAFVDVVLLAPSVAMQGGPPPAELLARSRAGRSASPADVTATVCALAGHGHIDPG